MQTKPLPRTHTMTHTPTDIHTMTVTRRYLPVLLSAEADHARKHPDWGTDVLVRLIHRGLSRLRHHLEDDPVGGGTWDEPFLELHHPVPWDWDPTYPGGLTGPADPFLQLTEADFGTRADRVRTLGDLMTSRLYLRAMAKVTGGAWYEQRGEVLVPVLPAALCARLEAIPDPQERQKAIAGVMRPFAIGAGCLDLDGVGLTDGVPLPETVVQQLEDLPASIDIPRMVFRADIGGRQLELALVFLVHPMIADLDARRAFYRVTVGLFLVPPVPGIEPGSPTPADWPRSERQQLWEGILAALDRSPQEVITAPAHTAEVVLSVGTTPEVPAAV